MSYVNEMNKINGFFPLNKQILLCYYYHSCEGRNPEKIDMDLDLHRYDSLEGYGFWTKSRMEIRITLRIVASSHRRMI